MWSIAFWAFFALAGVAALTWFLLAVVGAKRAATALGSPTPEDARVKTDAIDRETQRQMKEERNAPMPQKLDRARALRERGRLQRGDK